MNIALDYQGMLTGRLVKFRLVESLYAARCLEGSS